MSKVAFIQNIWAEILGVLSLSAYLKRGGHETRVYIEPGERDLIREIVAWKPDIVAFSVCTGTHTWALEISRRLKKHLRCPMVFGGNHPTFSPVLIEDPAVDVICRGEGEEALLELTDCVAKGWDYSSIMNLTVKTRDGITENPLRNLNEDLDLLPFMDRELYRSYSHFRRQTQWPIMTTRGCPHLCRYCHNHVKMKLYEGLGQYVRHRSPENVIEELKRIKAQYTMNHVYFWDDTFGLDKNWFYRFLALYRKHIDIPFFCFILPGHHDEDMIRELKASRCMAVPVAVETGNESLRRTLLGKEGCPDETYLELAGWLHKHRLPFGTLNILGLPGESLDDSFTTMFLNWKLKPFYAWALMFQPYPGTELSEHCIQQGYVTREEINTIGPHWYNHSILRKPEIREQINLHKLFALGVKYPFMAGLIQDAVHYRPNLLFDLIYLGGYGRYNKYTQGLSFSQFLTVAGNGAKLWLASSKSP